MVGQHAREKADALCPEAEQSLNLEIIDGQAGKIDDAVEALQRCLGAFRTVGLFGGGKVVWFRNITFLSNKVISKNEQVKRLLAELEVDLKAGLAADQMLILSASGIDKRSAFFKTLKSIAQVEEYAVPERDYEARPIALQRTKDLFKREGYSIDRAASELFVDRAGYDTRQIINEAEKMVLYKGEEKTITTADVELMTSPSNEAISWDFTDAIADRNLPQAIILFRQLLFQKQTAIGLIIQVESLYQHLLNFREYIDAGWLRMNGRKIEWGSSSEIETYFAELPDDPRKMHWFRAGKFANQASRYTTRSLAARKQRVVDTHERMLSGGSIPHELMFETLLARLCAPAAKRR